MNNVVEGTENEADMLWGGPVSKCRKDTNYLGWIMKWVKIVKYLVD